MQEEVVTTKRETGSSLLIWSWNCWNSNHIYVYVPEVVERNSSKQSNWVWSSFDFQKWQVFFFFRNKYHRRAMRGDVSGRNYGYSWFLACRSHPWNYVQACAHTALHQLIEYLPWLLPWKEVPYQQWVHGWVKRTTTRGVIGGFCVLLSWLGQFFFPIGSSWHVISWTSSFCVLGLTLNPISPRFMVVLSNAVIGSKIQIVWCYRREFSPSMRVKSWETILLSASTNFLICATCFLTPPTSSYPTSHNLSSSSLFTGSPSQ